jgi:hypothetical protein
MKDDVLQAVIAGAKANGSWDARYGEVSIKEALAQPDYRAVKTYHEGKPVYVSQPEQEPVAWFSTLPDGRLSIKIVGKPTEGNWEPLYTTPPKRPWVGLTDEDIAYAYTLEKKFAMQYVDAKLKELNA